MAKSLLMIDKNRSQGSRSYAESLQQPGIPTCQDKTTEEEPDKFAFDLTTDLRMGENRK